MAQAGNRGGGLAIICRSCWTGNNLWELYWFLLLRQAINLQDLQFKYFCGSLGLHGLQSFADTEHAEEYKESNLE